MVHLKSSAKSLRQSRKRARENEKIKERLNALTKNAKGEKALAGLYKAIDKAAKRGIFRKKKAARMKSSLAKKLTQSS